MTKQVVLTCLTPNENMLRAQKKVLDRPSMSLPGLDVERQKLSAHCSRQSLWRVSVNINLPKVLS